MSWTYDPTQFLSVTAGTYAGSTIGARNQIRLWIQDTNTNRQLFQDEEIDFTQTREANDYMAAAALCDVLVAKASGVKSKRISEFSISYDPAFYRTLGLTLRARGMNYQVPYAGGISVGDKLAQQMDSDWVTPSIVRNLDNNPQAPQPGEPGIGGVAGPNSLTSI